MFTAWYGLIPYIKQITFPLLKVNVDIRAVYYKVLYFVVGVDVLYF